MAFMFPQPQQAMTPEGISRQRMIANALMQQGMDASPVQHWSQGLNRVAQALLGGYQNKQANEADATLQRRKELEAATEKAKAEAEKRNTPEFKFGPDGSLYNWNPYMAEGGKPLLLSQATQKADEWKSAGDGQFYRTGADGMPEYAKAPGYTAKRKTVNVNGVPYYEDTKEPVIPNSAAGEAAPEFKENQVRVGEFSRRMVSANDAIDAAMEAGADPTTTWMGGNITSDDSRWNSAQWQQYKQGKDAFILAGLRKDTGASISEREYTEMDRTYFPQPGDKPEVVQQKAAARKQLQADLAAASGGAFDYMEKQNPRGAAPTKSGGKTFNSIEELAPNLSEGTVFKNNETGQTYKVQGGKIVEVQP